MTLISVFKQGDKELDRWADFGHLLMVGDTLPARGFQPSGAPQPRWRVWSRFVDYRNNSVTYQVVETM